jgi:two-component system sensor histidine kinase PilS (NtrC family)
MSDMLANVNLNVPDAPFVRLWRGFLTSRVMVAVALLLLQSLGSLLSQTSEPAIFALCVTYLGTTLVQRMLLHTHPPKQSAGPQWLGTIGFDIAMVCLLQLMQQGNMNYTPLLGVPVLMAAVLGSLTLALGTTASVTLLLLAWSWWLGTRSGNVETQRYLQSALTGTGYFIVAYLVHQLASRLTREQELARQGLMTAQLQTEVSALVIQSLSDGVLVMGEDNTVRTANPAALRLLDDSANPQPPFNLGQLPAWQPLVQLARTTFAKEQPQTADVDLLHPGQSPTGLHVRTWLTSSTGNTQDAMSERLCVMFLHDLREMEARLRTEKLASMGRMSAAVAHEIRNPLAAIVQANALLEEDLQDPQHKRLTDMVRQNADRLARIAEEVLDIARVQHQISHTPASTLALDETVAQICSDWKAQEPHKRPMTVSLNTDSAQVEFDADHLRRVLVNLLDNALRYMRRGPDSLTVTTKVNSAGHVSLQVWSDGAPLDKSVERHLFEPFFSSESRSSGLGLYICRELCNRHGANIRYARISLETGQGLASGNAFTVNFRRTTRPVGPSTLFDAPVV